MRDYAVFKDGHKEEIIHWRQYGTKSNIINFLTPTGIYRYEESTLDEPNVKGNHKIISVVTNHFYKYMGAETDYEYCFGSRFYECEFSTKAKWQLVQNIESINFNREQYPFENATAIEQCNRCNIRDFCRDFGDGGVLTCKEIRQKFLETGDN